MTASNDDPSSEDCEFYWSEEARIDPDGTISMPISGYVDQGTIHWNGRLEIASGEDDYLLWA